MKKPNKQKSEKKLHLGRTNQAGASGVRAILTMSVPGFVGLHQVVLAMGSQARPEISGLEPMF